MMRRRFSKYVYTTVYNIHISQKLFVYCIQWYIQYTIYTFPKNFLYIVYSGIYSIQISTNVYCILYTQSFQDVYSAVTLLDMTSTIQDHSDEYKIHCQL